jgi:hypothetical protein
MSHYLNHPEFFNGPIRLTEEETNDPLKVVTSFFEDYSLSEIRDHNQQMDFVCCLPIRPLFKNRPNGTICCVTVMMKKGR